ncbi:MAG: hypothetical protein B0W54_15900 [Cellvibrio sp. 79]|nr:MAG: hypothetical protein B0W54_15900 [Cellvibrio sp. 79]
MKFKLCSIAVMTAALLLQGCGGSGGLVSDADKDKNPLNPAPGVEDPTARPRPSDTALTITTDETTIYDAAKKPLLLRGIDMQLGAAPTLTRINGIKAIKETGSNVVRLYINENTTDPDLENAMVKVVEQGLVAIVTLESDKLTCSSNTAALNSAVDTLWLKKWLGVIAQDRFQPYLIINMASGWGPEGVFNPDSFGYQDYLDAYKAMIGKFRTAGLKVPIAIDAPCGQDYHAFARDRSRTLVSADTAKNIILSVQADGSRWNSGDKLTSAVTNLMEAGAPFAITSFTGSGTSDTPIDHVDLIARSVGDRALAINLPWTTADDSAAYTLTLPQSANLAGGAELATNLYLDSRYLELQKISDADGKLVPKGKLLFTLYIKDVNGNSLSLGSAQAQDLRGYQWNKLRYAVPRTQEDIDPANLINGSATFDLTKVTQVGFQLAANGKSPDIKAVFKLDDLIILPGVPPLKTYKFESDTEGWAGLWDKPQEIGQADGSLTLLRKGNEIVIGKSTSAGELDFTKELLFTIRIKIPADDPMPSWAGGQMIAKFGPGYTEKSKGLSIGGLSKGDWVDWKVAVDFRSEPNANDLKEIVFQLWSLDGVPTSPILIDSITVTDVNAKPTKIITDTQYKSSFVKNTDGFVVDWGGKSTVAAVDGELVINTVAGDSGLVNKSNVESVNEINFGGGITVKAKVFIPADYAANDLWMQFIFQDGNYKHFSVSPGLSLASFTPGEWTALEFIVKETDYPAVFSRTLKPKVFGFQFANTVAGSIKVKDFEIIGQLVVDDSQPLFNATFETKEQFNGVTLDRTGGAFTPTALANAKSESWKIVPFGWLATSWFGNTGDKAVLNISNTEDRVDLTKRGEEVVNGFGGIAETAKPASFK